MRTRCFGADSRACPPAPRANRLDHVARATSNFEIDTPHILCDKADGEEYDAEEEDQDCEQREDGPKVGFDGNAPGEENQAEDESADGRDDSDETDDLNRNHREPG